MGPGIDSASLWEELQSHMAKGTDVEKVKIGATNATCHTHLQVHIFASVMQRGCFSVSGLSHFYEAGSRHEYY